MLGVANRPLSNWYLWDVSEPKLLLELIHDGAVVLGVQHELAVLRRKVQACGAKEGIYGQTLGHGRIIVTAQKAHRIHRERERERAPTMQPLPAPPMRAQLLARDVVEVTRQQLVHGEVGVVEVEVGRKDHVW